MNWRLRVPIQPEILDERSSRQLYKIGFLGYAMLMVLALIFYMDRTVFLDVSLLLFNIVKDETFSIQVYRYGVVFTQIFPLLARKLSMPLEGIMMVYSGGVIFYYAFCYWLCGSVFKKYEIALCLLLFNILFASDTFFWIQAELAQGAALLLFTVAYVSSKNILKYKALSIPLLIALTVTVSFFHPILFIPALYIVLFFTIQHHHITNKWLFITAILIFILAQVIKENFFTNFYDDQATEQGKNVFKYFPNYHKLYSVKQFVKHCFGKFIWIPVASVMIFVAAIRQKRWTELLLFVCTAAAYVILISATYHYEGIRDFYIENMLLPLAIIIGFPFVYFVLPAMKNKRWPVLILLVLIISSGARIFNSKKIITQRLNWEREYLAEHRKDKLLIHSSKLPKDTLMFTWGFPYEMWLLSTTEYGETASMSAHDNMETIRWVARNGLHKDFATEWGTFAYDKMPKQYFIFTDSVSKYKIIE